MHRLLAAALCFLMSLSLPAWAEQVSKPASLRQQLPENTVIYVRVPTVWGLFSGIHHSALQAAQAHPTHQQQVAKLIDGIKKNLLPEFQAMGAPLPVLNLALSDLHAPLELAVILPPNAPPTSAMGLLRTQLKLGSLKAANEWLTALTQQMPVQVQQAFDEKGFAIVSTEQLPLLLHYSPDSKHLHVMLGLLATPEFLQQTLNSLKSVDEHPMYSFEERIDSSHQGLFSWVFMEKLMPLVQGSMPPAEQEQLKMSGFDQTRAIAFGYGSSQGKGRLQLLIDAPKGGYRALLPPIKNYLDITSSGHPSLVFSFNFPAHALFKNLQTFAQTDMLSMQESIAQAEQEFLKAIGVPLEDMLKVFGDELVS